MFQKQYKDQYYQATGEWQEIPEEQVRSELGKHYVDTISIVNEMVEAPGRCAQTPFALYQYVIAQAI